MTLRRLPAGFNSAATNDLIQKHSDGLWYAKAPADLLGLDTAIIPGRLLVRTFHATPAAGATHNLNALTTKFRVYGQAAGGGGGGADGSGGGTATVGGAGQSGGYFDHIFTLVGSIFTFTYNVGTGGTAGNGTGPTSGGLGGATSVTYNAVTVGANGGSGGAGATAVGVLFMQSPATGGGAIIGTPDLGIPGQSGTLGIVLTIGQVAPGMGGSNVLAKGGRSFVTPSGTPSNGVDGIFGGGGSGAAVGDTTAEPDGGSGGNGILIVEEYS